MYRRTTNDNTYPRSTEGIEEKYIDVPLTMKITKYTNIPLKVNYQRPTGGRKRCIAVPLTMKITKYTNFPLKVNYQRPTGGRKRCIAVPLTITHTHVPPKVLKRNTSTYH